MNIQEAKKEICNTLRAYLAKDENGYYIYPLVRQRPILLIGPPGIGKTAIMEQAASECGVGLVSYTITHHTRQSAIGLPEIVKRNYGGKGMMVTDYTMSEIVASVYDCMEKTGKKEGILFIDEINCVSETLAPAMLALLQNKTFGSHKIPEGWVLVAAGNPPEYNKSVREFDIVTLDRVRKLVIEPDCEVWLRYAGGQNVHQAILSYLSMKKERFYSVENTVDGKFFVTARGWEDLSRLIQSYEKLGIEINAELVGEFLQKEETARDFAGFYQLYTKYGEDYQIPAILNGELSSEKLKQKQQMAAGGTFEERFAVVNLIQGTLRETAERYENVTHQIEVLHELLLHLRNHVKKISQDEKERDQLPSGISALEEFAQEQDNSLQVKIKMELLSLREQKFQETAIHRLREYILAAKKEHLRSAENGFKRICKYFEEEAARRENLVQKMHRELQSAFSFIKESFGDGQEMLLLVTGITADNTMTTFIAENGCPAYFQYSEMLLYNKEEKNLQKACAEAIQAI
nr:AAA family ATPase [uncultured Blautia sp.]